MTDLRHALRSLGRAPGFTLLAVLTLALGLGSTTAVFSVVDGVLLRALPYPDADRIVMVSEADSRSRTRRVSNPNFQDWTAAARSFSAMAAWVGGPATVLGGSEPVVTGVYAVTHRFFDVLGVAPAIGRPFTPDETREHGTPAVIVGHALWQRVLGGRSDLTGVTLRLEGVTAAVVGVMPPGFEYPAGAEVWIPKELTPDTSGRTAHNLHVIARLAPGVTLAQAQAEMSAIAGALEAQHGDDHDNPDASVERLQDRLVGPARRLLLVLLGAVLLVLLGACVNVASMLVARGTGRRRELAVRLALGAGRLRLARLLLVEHLLLALAGGVLGLLVASALVRALVAIAPGQLPRLDEVALDGTAMLVGLLLAALTPTLFGLLPTLQLSRPDLRDALAESGRSAAAWGRSRIRHLLVAVEVALALLLLCGTGLLTRSVVRLLATDPGFQPAGVVTLQTTLPVDRYPDGPRAARFYAAMLERVGAIDGVVAAGLSNEPPFAGRDADGAFLYEGQSFDEIRGHWQSQSASYRVVGGDYFRTMGVPVVRGRTFDAGDVAGAEPVALVNQTMARRYFAGQDPIGRRIRFAGMDRDNPWLTIVGIVGDVRHRLASDAVPEVYVHYLQRPMRLQYVVTTVARMSPGASLDALAPRLRQAVRQLDPDVPVEMSTMSALLARSVADRRFAMLLLTAFGAMALVLAAVGIYSVLAQAVAARTPEIGVRMALGASRRAVAGLILREALGAVAGGAVAGLVAAGVLTRLLGSLLYQVQPIDLPTYAGVLAVVAIAALIAGLAPAYRAMRVDPVVPMRGE